MAGWRSHRLGGVAALLGATAHRRAAGKPQSRQCCGSGFTRTRFQDASEHADPHLRPTSPPAKASFYSASPGSGEAAAPLSWACRAAGRARFHATGSGTGWRHRGLALGRLRGGRTVPMPKNSASGLALPARSLVNREGHRFSQATRPVSMRRMRPIRASWYARRKSKRSRPCAVRSSPRHWSADPGGFCRHRSSRSSSVASG